MKAKVNFKLGHSSYQLEIDEPSAMDTLHQMAVLGNPPSFCHECKNNQYFRLDSNKDKEGNTYVNVICTAKGCGAKSKLGQYKTGGYFWRNFEKWIPTGQSQSDASSDDQEDNDEVPF